MTYQERRRDGPDDVLATFNDGANSHFKRLKEDENY